MNIKPTKEIADRHKLLRLSASSISKFEISPKYYKDFIDGKIEDISTSYFEIGTKLHMYLLEPEKFKENYIFLEFTKPKGAKQEEFCQTLLQKIKALGEFKTDVELAVEAYTEVYAAATKQSEEKRIEEATALHNSLLPYIQYLKHATVYKDVINKSTMKFLALAKTAVETHKLASRLLFDKTKTSYEELRILWEYPKYKIDDTPIVLKSFIDKFIIDDENKEIILVDLKTSSKAYNFKHSFDEFKYYRQFAFYWLALASQMLADPTLKEKYNTYAKKTYVIVIQTTAGADQLPVECRVFKIKDDSLQKGWDELDSILGDIVWHYTENKWDHTKDYYITEGIESTL